MHKFFKVISVFLIFIFCFNIYSLSDDMNDSEENIELNTIEASFNNNSLSSINARAYVVIDRNSNTILCGKNEMQQKKMASTTKIMTAIVIIENYNLTDSVVVSKKAANTGGSRLGLKTGDKITVQDLLYGLMLCSGNDAAVALAEYACGSIDNFSILMNQKADELHLTNSHFVTPHGLDSDNHYTTAYELALLTNYCLNNETFAKIVGTKNITITINNSSKSLTNTNELLGYLDGVYGVKTGFTNGANRCLVTACKRGNLDIICVVLGCDTKKFRTSDSIKLIEYVYDNFELVNVEDLMKTELINWQKNNTDYFIINKANNDNLNLVLDEVSNPIIPINKQYAGNLEVVIDCSKILYAPVEKNAIIGLIQVKYNDNVVCFYNILSDVTIEKNDIIDYLELFFKNYINIFQKILG